MSSEVHKRHDITGTIKGNGDARRNIQLTINTCGTYSLQFFVNWNNTSVLELN